MAFRVLSLHAEGRCLSSLFEKLGLLVERRPDEAHEDEASLTDISDQRRNVECGRVAVGQSDHYGNQTDLFGDFQHPHDHHRKTVGSEVTSHRSIGAYEGNDDPVIEHEEDQRRDMPSEF